MDLSHLQHGNLKGWRLMRAGSLGCLIAAGLVLVVSLATNAYADGAAMSTLHTLLASLTPG